jgi:hypothetical protein
MIATKSTVYDPLVATVLIYLCRDQNQSGWVSRSYHLRNRQPQASDQYQFVVSAIRQHLVA